MWLIRYLLLAAILTAASEAGFRVGCKAEPGTADRTRPQLAVVEGGIAGVLALLLGFTVSMAVNRFEVRKQLVLQEANAIGTSYLRTQLLPAPEGTEIANLLRQYVTVRLQDADARDDRDRFRATREQAAHLQNEIWNRAVAHAQKDPTIKTGLLLQSLNQVIDVEAARWMAFQDHVPRAVIYVNFIVAFFATILVGYAFGLAGQRQIFSTSVWVLAITVVLEAILDLNRPGEGFIKESQQPLIDLQHQLLISKR